MSIENLVLFFIACGAATFPLTLMALRFAASLRPAGWWSHKIASVYEAALSLTLVLWIVGALVFYIIALHIERQKPCDQQHTNQLTPFCKKELGAADL